MLICIHTSIRSNRLEYICQWLFNERLDLDFCIVVDGQPNQKEDTLHINYNSNPDPVHCALNLWQHQLLTEKDIQNHIIEVDHHQGLPYFFQSDRPDHYDLPFDIFALIFYLISRYEEYGDPEVDIHGRYEGTQSIASKYNFLHLPVVDLWIERLRLLIENASGHLLPSTSRFMVCPTIDIDLPYAYRTKSIKNLLALARDTLLFKWDKVQMRLTYLLSKTDPFDTYEYLTNSLKGYGDKAIFFFLCKYQKPFDENFLVHHPLFRQIVSKLDKSFSIGIHPSYTSDSDKSKIGDEKSILSEISGSTIRESRQHFIKLKWPDTYRSLLSCGINGDHSMIYPDLLGFRASTCHPFYWYDILEDCPTILRIYSPCVMDVTLKNYQEMSPSEAIEQVVQLRNRVKQVNGRFEFIWHNSSFSSLHGWEGWTEVYKELIKRE